MSVFYLSDDNSKTDLPQILIRQLGKTTGMLIPSSVSDPDPDPVGSVSFGRIRIRIRIRKR